MGALGSVEILEEIIEAANALVSAEKSPPKPEGITEAREIAKTADQDSPREPKTHTPNFIPRLCLALKSRMPYLFFLATFAIWLVSLLAIYLPVSGLVTPSFSLTVDDTAMTIFLVSAGLGSVSSLLIGLRKLGK